MTSSTTSTPAPSSTPSTPSTPPTPPPAPTAGAGSSFTGGLLASGSTAATRSIVASAIAYERTRSSSPAWGLLRAANGPVVAAILSQVFHTTRRVVVGSELLAEVTDALEDLREHFDLPRAAVAYINEWVSSGYLIRRSPTGTTEETYELSTEALSALDFIATLATPKTTATRSRLATMAQALHDLANHTDPNAAAVIARLEGERAAIDARIEAIRTHGVDMIADDDALERVHNILTLVRDLPADFARVRSEVENIAVSLRAEILNRSVGAAEILDGVFRGVDLINDSDAGRSFHGFYDLLFDPESSAGLDAALTAVLSRPFISRLDSEAAEELAWMVKNLETASTDVHTSMTTLARSLRRFVQSREAESQQALLASIQQAQALAIEVGRTMKPATSIGVDIELSARSFQPISRLRLYDPKDSYISPEVDEAAPGTATLEELIARVRESEIDFAELHRAVDDVLTRQATATVGEVLAEHPATQGLASIVGLLRISFEEGTRFEGTETISWSTRRGTATATLPRYGFRRAHPDPGTEVADYADAAHTDADPGETTPGETPSSPPAADTTPSAPDTLF
ncbi:DUF3375 domain-containing protein [Corynebacterium sp. 13CS0277]|uniref:DUF3375 domain-containing protein n=1 Tax=Corynebacterium sp. 13CS0277 TaxID=2071994 RepID=UPI001304BEF3|nr:DUF3375 domain-containing protein [Corynebacterium sp. 13CS0277]